MESPSRLSRERARYCQSSGKPGPDMRRPESIAAPGPASRDTSCMDCFARRVKRTLFGPTIQQALAELVTRHARHFTCLRKRSELPAIQDHPVGASVSSLFRPGRPSAVSGLIVARVLDALDLSSRRPWPHVETEAVEAGQIAFAREPPIADRDAATTIAGISLVAWVEASTAHAGPNDVMRAPVLHAAVDHLPRLVVRWGERFSAAPAVRAGLAVPATAAIGGATLDRHAVQRDLVPTSTCISPEELPVPVTAGLLDGGEQPIGLAGQRSFSGQLKRPPYREVSFRKLAVYAYEQPSTWDHP